MALFTLEDYQAFLPESLPASQRDAVAAVCDGVSQAVEKFLGRPLGRLTRTEYYSTTGDEWVVLNVRPVWAVSEVRFDADGRFGQTPGSFGATTVLTPGSDYYLDLARGTPSYSGILYAGNIFWGYGVQRGLAGPGSSRLSPERHALPGALMVTYDAGYDPIPADVLMACAQTASQVRSMIRLGGPVVLEKLGDALYKRATDELKSNPELGGARQVLGRYREVPW